MLYSLIEKAFYQSARMAFVAEVLIYVFVLAVGKYFPQLIKGITAGHVLLFVTINWWLYFSYKRESKCRKGFK